MAPNANKDPIGDLIDKLRSFFGIGNHGKNQDCVAEQDAFQHLVFCIRHTVFFLSAAVFLFFENRDDFL